MRPEKGLSLVSYLVSVTEFNLSSLWDVPQYLIMAFSLALDAPVEKASRVSLSVPPAQHTTAAAATSLPEENFWLRSVKLAAPKSDILTSYGERIFITSSGRYYVPAERDRVDILALRRNGQVTARVLAAATAVLREDIERRSGLAATRGALLVAHMVGVKSALAYLEALNANPDGKAAEAVPSLAKLIGGDARITLGGLDARLSRTLRAVPEQIAARASGETETFKGTLTKPEASPPSPAHLARR